MKSENAAIPKFCEPSPLKAETEGKSAHAPPKPQTRNIQKQCEKYNPSNITLKDIDFNLMYKNYFNPLCRYAAKIVNQESEDIVHDLFVTMQEKRDTIYIKGALSPYLYRSIYNNCLKNLDHIKLERKYYENVQSNQEDIDYLHTHDKNPQSIFIMQETNKIIEETIEALPEQCRKVFKLWWVEGLIYQEIAVKLGISVTAVGVQMNRARTKIRKSIEKHGYTKK